MNGEQDELVARWRKRVLDRRNNAEIDEIGLACDCAFLVPLFKNVFNGLTRPKIRLGGRPVLFQIIAQLVLQSCNGIASSTIESGLIIASFALA